MTHQLNNQDFLNHRPFVPLFLRFPSLKRVLMGGVLAILAFHAFSGALSCSFVNFDDPDYVTQNPHVLQGLTKDSIRWAFTSVEHANWHPLTWLSHMLDVELYGTNPQGHHFTSLCIHTINALLCFWLFCRMTGQLWPSWFIALFFAIHPLRVESVVWISERKDVLCAFFGLLSLISYIAYVQKNRRRYYLLAGVFLVLGLLSKSMLVTWPFLFLVLDYWPLKRFPKLSPCQGGVSAASGGGGRGEKVEEGRGCKISRPIKYLMIEKLPFILLVGVFCGIAYRAQESGGAVIQTYLPLSMRLQNGVISYIRYIEKLFFPLHLAHRYPFHFSPATLGKFFTCLLTLALISYLVFKFRRKRPWLVTGWLWYLGTLVPVIGIIQIGVSAMADRYTYLPCLGLLLIIVMLGTEAAQRGRIYRAVLTMAAFAAGVALMVLSWIQTSYWKDSLTLFEHTIKVTDGNPVAWLDYGNELQRCGREKEAVELYEKTRRLYTDFPEPLIRLGKIYLEQKKYELAEKMLYQACQLTDFKSPEVLRMLAIACLYQNKISEAERYMQKGLENATGAQNRETKKLLLLLQEEINKRKGLPPTR